MKKNSQRVPQQRKSPLASLPSPDKLESEHWITRRLQKASFRRNKARRESEETDKVVEPPLKQSDEPEVAHKDNDVVQPTSEEEVIHIVKDNKITEMESEETKALIGEGSRGPA